MSSFANVAVVTYDGVPSFPVEEHRIVSGISQALAINVSNLLQWMYNMKKVCFECYWPPRTPVFGYIQAFGNNSSLAYVCLA